MILIYNLFTGGGSSVLTLAPYAASQSSSSTRTESTLFDQVYSGPRRRPAMISLNVQWVPAERSGTYQWSGGDTSSQKVKTVTFFGTGEMRGQQQANAVTPPSSDYTDAYLSAFASKQIPTRHVHRLNTTVFANSVPIPLKPTSTPLSTSNSTKTSETRFININNIQPSKSFDKPVPPPPSRSSSYSTSFAPEKPTPYEPFSTTQYSSPQSQTFTSSYSTLLRSPTSTITSTLSPSIDSPRSYTTLQNFSQPASSTYPTVYRSQPSSSTFPTTYQTQTSSSIFPTIYRSQTAYESIYKPLPAYSIQSYPPSNTYSTSLSSPSSSTTGSTYKPFVPFQTAPLSPSYNFNESSSTSEHIVLPTPKIEKPIERPETLLFQHDEDIRSSGIEKLTPIISPSPDSPTIREEYKVEAERSHKEDLSINSEPIQILENTLSKYESLIDQISDVLASVSPLSSTVSSMSPGKSVLDYQLSSDGSPILPHRRVESESSQQATTTAKTSSTQRTKPGHLIREDSYDKIVTAISDLDTDIISPSDVQKNTETIKEEKDESTTPSLDETPTSLTTEEEKLQSNIPSQVEDQSQLETKQEKEDVTISSIPQEENEETKSSSTEEQQSSSTTNGEIKDSLLNESQTSPVSEEQKKEEAQIPSADDQQPASIPEEIKEETKVLSADEQQTSSITEEEKKEDVNVLSTNENQAASTVKEEKEEELKTSFIDQPQIPSIAEEEKKSETITDEHLTTSIVEEKKEETQVPSSDEYQPKVPSEEEKVQTETTLPEENQISSVTEKENEETKTESSDEHQTTPAVEQEKEETKITLSDEQQTPSAPEESQVLAAVLPSEASTSEIDQPSEAKSDEDKVVDKQSVVETTSENAELVQQQTGLLTNAPNDAPVTEELAQSPVDAASTKKTGKHVTWDETVVDNEDDDSSSHQSPVEENSTSEAYNVFVTTENENATTDEEKTAADQQIASSDNTELQITSDQTISPPTSIEPTITLPNTNDQQVPTSDSDLQTTSSEQQLSSTSYSDNQTNLQVATTEQHTESSSPPETSSTVSDSTDQQITSSDLIESKEDTSAVNEASKTTEEVTIDEHKAENMPHKSETPSSESTTSSLQPTIVSPVDTVADTIANRFISSDVYHGYLGDHKEFLQVCQIFLVLYIVTNIFHRFSFRMYLI